MAANVYSIYQGPSAGGQGAGTRKPSAPVQKVIAQGALKRDPTPTAPKPPTTPRTTTGSRSSSSGGGGGGMSQAAMNQLAQIIGQSRPDQIDFNAYSSNPYQAPEFYDFDSSPYDTARTGLNDALAADRASGAAAYGDARTELNQYQNPYYQAPVTQNPAMSQAMRRMIQANQGAGQGAANQAWNEAGAADQAMLRTFGMLGANDQARQAAAGRALAGDERRFNEGLNAEGRGLGLGIDMALASARSQYKKDEWMYGTQVARQLYEDREQQAIMNWQRENQVSDSNVNNRNSWAAGVLPAITQLAAQRPSGDMSALLKILGGGQ